jgi:hypothetical protein
VTGIRKPSRPSRTTSALVSVITTGSVTAAIAPLCRRATYRKALST